MIIANYAEVLIKKFKRFATYGKMQYEDANFNDFEQYKLDPNKVKFEEVLFLRILYEFSKTFSRERSVEFMEKLDDILPEFDDY